MPGSKKADSTDSALMDLVSREIIPRLGQTSKGRVKRTSEPGSSLRVDEQIGVAIVQSCPPPDAQTAELIARIGRRAIVADRAACERIIAQERSRGRTLQSVLLDLLQPAARHLGTLWDDDAVHFTDVTLGVWTLDQIVGELVAEFSDAGPSNAETSSDQASPSTSITVSSHTALFCTLPGSQHRFGIQMLGAFFVGAGWSATVAHAGDEHSLLEQLTRSSTDIVGLSVASESELRNASMLIAHMRERFTDTRGPCIMLGGPGAIAFPDLARSVGADGVSGDAADALRLATTLVTRGAR